MVENTSASTLTITAATDDIEATTLDLLQPEYCPQFATSLDAGEEQACTFTLDRYLRDYTEPPRSGVTNTVRIVATDGTHEFVAQAVSTVVKTNDADGDGAFTNEERATVAGQDIPFEVVVRNTSPDTATLENLNDTWPGLDEPIDLFEHCPDLDGARLRGTASHAQGDRARDGDRDSGGTGHQDAGDGDPASVTCRFTLMAYSPAAETSLTNRVSATLVHLDDPELRVTVSDTSTVTTPLAPPDAPDNDTDDTDQREREQERRKGEQDADREQDRQKGEQDADREQDRQKGEELPVTGGEVAQPLMLALASLLLGFVLVAALRRDRTGGTVTSSNRRSPRHDGHASRKVRTGSRFSITDRHLH